MEWVGAKEYLAPLCLLLYCAWKVSVPLHELRGVADCVHACRKLFKLLSTWVFPALISCSERATLVRNSGLKSPRAPARRSKLSTSTSTRALLQSGLNVTVSVVMEVMVAYLLYFLNGSEEISISNNSV